MAEIGDIYPGTGERVVAKIPNPNGPGFYLQGEYGGVFAEGGAESYGSYFSLDAKHRNDPNRRFTGIEGLEGGGYRSISANPEEAAGYSFRPPPAATSAPAAATQTPAEQRAASPEGTSAKGELARTLATYGLPASLVNTLWDQWYVQEGRPFGQIMIDLEDTPEFKQRFPGLSTLKDRQRAGETVQIPTVAEYIQLEVGVAQVLSDAGLPKDLWNDPSDYAKWIGGSTSPKEVSDRIGFARTLAFQMPAETREELNRVYDISEGELIAFVLDPDKALPVIQNRVLGAGIGGQAKKVGFGLLTQAEMEAMAGSGVTEAQAAERFGALNMLGEGVFAETVEERQAGEDLGRATQIGFATAGEAGEEARQITTRRRRRAANFEGGGGAATGGAGRTGLGS